MSTEKTAIGILSITAALLLAAVLFLPRHATGGQVTIKDNDFLVAAGPAVGGSDALYIAETRNTGVIAAFVWDPNARQLVPRARRRILDAFGGR